MCTATGNRLLAKDDMKNSTFTPHVTEIVRKKSSVGAKAVL